MHSLDGSHSQIRVVRNITYGQILKGEIPYHEVYKAQVCEWIFGPARHLAALRSANQANTDHGMALLALLLLFFEPHGQYLSGKDSKGASQKTFEDAFKALIVWLVIEGRLDQQTSSVIQSNFYSFARCGLLHSAQLMKEFLVDPIGLTGQAFAPNDKRGQGWLIDPWRLLDDLDAYFQEYYLAISDTSHPDYALLRPPFEATFTRLVLDVLRSYV